MRAGRLGFRGLVSLALLLMALFLTGCFDKTAEQRKAFSGFLQNTVLRSTGVLPALSVDQQKQFGAMAAYYTVLYQYSQQVNQAMEQGVNPLVSSVNQLRQPEDYLTQRDSLRQSADALAVLSQQLRNAKTQADSAKAGLKFTDDLRLVYEQAYQKIVILPASGLQALLPAAQTLSGQLVQVGDFLQQQGSQATFTGSGVQFPAAAQVNQYNLLIAPLASQYQVFNRAYQVTLDALK